ncbi:TAXI family TRAP transporter solute-binding subunit [Bacillus sp. Marseille-P3661]|uniref:TAXI family TRAP transporter solute-binding subunit n=1 Tax=Bacillus sp. Marseille-P3661 TaxID=1936234 RepID=UPI000C85380A|nr:TAXI family TRAP transporter solute-binding subunit [Bacillus sp. Marseille-P3661]
MHNFNKIIGKVMVIMLIFAIMTACSSTSQNSSTSNNGSSNSTNSSESATNNDSAPKEDSKGETTTLSIGTSPNGSAFNTVTTGIASVVSSNSDMNVSVKPFAGPAAWMPMLNSGEIDMGFISYGEAVWALKGENGFQANKNLRTLVRGNYTTTIGAVVKADSGIETVADLKGKKVASDYAGNLVVSNIVESLLVMNGLSWDDVVKVPVPSAAAGIEALRDGRVDAAFGLGPTTALVVEADNAVGLKPLDFIDNLSPDQVNTVSEDVLKELSSRVAGAELKVLNEGYLKEDTIGGQYPLMLAVSAELSEDAAYNMVKALWEHYEELHPIFSWLESWTPELMFDPKPSVPYHPGVIKFFKEQGLWNDETEKIQQELMELTK